MSDYINREAVIEMLWDLVELDNSYDMKKQAVEIVQKWEPSDVRENVRGEWRTTYLDHVAMWERPKILYCSVCNQCIAYPTNYCPNCGAEMRGDNNV